MGMSTHAYAIKPPDERWQAMKTIWDACEAAGVEPPEEVIEFFAEEPPDPAGVVTSLGAIARKWSGQDSEGLEVDLASLPKGTRTVRFCNSW